MRQILSFLLIIISISASAQHIRHTLRNARQKDASRVTALVRCTDRQALADNDCRVLAEFRNNIYITEIPLKRLHSLGQCTAVSRIEANALCTADMDTTRTLLGIDRAQQLLPHGSGASNVVVGVQDVGFDLTHPTFFSADGTYRIKRFWDMVDTLRIDTILPVGREYTSENEILTKAHATDGLIIAHGTHTAGIAAGSGWNGQSMTEYTVHQSLPDIVLVNNATSEDLELIPDSLQTLYTTALDLLGFKYIFDYADAVGKPCVINFSEGCHQDFYDNTLYDEVLQQLIGPGRIIVASAGNEGLKLSYLDKPAGTPEAHSLYYSNSPQALVTLRSDADINVRVTFDALGTNPFNYEIKSKNTLSDSTYVDTLQVNDATYVVNYTFYPNCYDTLHIAGEVYVKDLTHTAFGGRQQRVCLALFDEDSNTTCHQEMFYYIGQFWETEEMPSQAISTHNVHFPSSSPSVISVGGTVYRHGVTNCMGEWMQASDEPDDMDMYDASSVGPTLANLPKPDVVAPGVNIISSYSSYYLEANPTAYDVQWDVERFPWNGRTYAWTANSGTSMSAPLVTAIIAQWLSVCPTLTTEQILKTLAATAHKPLPNVRGYGEIDACEGLQYVINNFVDGDGIEETKNEELRMRNAELYDLSGRRVSAASHPGIYIANGRKVIIQ